MSETIKRFLSFIKLLLKKWIIWLSLVIFVIGILFEFLLHIENIPSYIFWILAFVGFLRASFQIYKKLYIDYEKLEKDHEQLEKDHEQLKKDHEQLKMKIPKKDREIIIKPELSIMLLEGNEYTYSLSGESSYHRAKTEKGYIVPDALIELHFRILNTGTIDLDIISIEVGYKKNELPWDFYHSAIPTERGKEVSYPRHLDVNKILTCDISSHISPDGLLNDAQFAARLLRIDKIIPSIEAKIIVETRDLTKKIQNFSITNEVAIRPLLDLYIAKWQKEKHTNLLRLAHSKIETDE